MPDPSLSPRVRRRPEVMAPAGDADALKAALEAGADAVYFGLDAGFNARARARNFSADNLSAVVAQIHRAGARAYLTLNTLIFESELPVVEQCLRQAAGAGVDAVIVQDPAVALIARAVCPELELHASTQMTISSPEAARFVASLGIRRIVTPRELSVSEIRQLLDGTDLEVEVFIVGAICVAWSGQCLSSEAWGGRSANRGLCAQACRLPYELIVDGRARPLGDVSYLLSPKDLAGFRAVPALLEMGVHGLKVEGRQKGPGYVHAAVTSVRRWIEALTRPGGAGPQDVRRLAEDVRDLSLSYSRGFSDGFLAGSNHQDLVEGRSPRHRGICLGQVEAIDGARVRVSPLRERPRAVGDLSSPLPSLGASPVNGSGPPIAPLDVVPGMGVVFDEGRPEEAEQGGPIFSVQRRGEAWWLGFGQPGPDLRRVRVGARVWVTSDPELQGRVTRLLKGFEPEGRIPMRVKLRGRSGGPLVVVGSAGRYEAEVSGQANLLPARDRGLDRETIEAKLCAFGGTPFRLESLDCADLEDGLFVPVSELKKIRRALVATLTDRVERGAVRTVSAVPSVEPVRQERTARLRPVPEVLGRLVPTCRTTEQLEAVIEAALPEVVLDWMDLVGLGRAVERAREAGLKVGIATVRVQKPGEEGYDRRIERLAPDSVLVRHWAGVMHFADRAQDGGDAGLPRVHGDFSLNVTNSITALHLLGLGLDTVTAAHDLDARQLLAMLESTPPHRVAVTIHHHIPTFHTEHCVYSHLLSQGRDHRSCGRPCEAHQLSLRDRTGNEHPVVVDVGCRNTVFNAAAQSAASLLPQLLHRGVGVFRVEFVRETHAQARDVLQACQALMEDRISPDECLRRVGGHEQFGVTAGTMQVMSREG